MVRDEESAGAGRGSRTGFSGYASPGSVRPRLDPAPNRRCHLVDVDRYADPEAGHLEGVDLAEPPAGDLDYLGLNYYRRDSVSARSDRAFDWEIGAAPGSEQTQMGWHVASDGLRDVLLELDRTYAPPEIVVTENGAAYPDTVV